MGKLLKALIVIIVIVVIFIACFGFVRTCVSRTIVGGAVSTVTGSEQAGDAVADIMSGKDLTDEELADALGLDADDFATVEKAANSIGIDLNDSEQLSGILAANASNLGALKDLAGKAASGDINAQELADELKDTIEIPGSN